MFGNVPRALISPGLEGVWSAAMSVVLLASNSGELTAGVVTRDAGTDIGAVLTGPADGPQQATSRSSTRPAHDPDLAIAKAA